MFPKSWERITSESIANNDDPEAKFGRLNPSYAYRKVGSMKIERYLVQGTWRRCWSNLCQSVAAASGNPKKAFRLMKVIERLRYEDLVEEHGMDTLWQKLRSELQKF